jgi:hypothetical protein
VADPCFGSAYGNYGYFAGIDIAAYEFSAQFAFCGSGGFCGESAGFRNLSFDKLRGSSLSSAAFSVTLYCNSAMHRTSICLLGMFRRGEGC